VYLTPIVIFISVSMFIPFFFPAEDGILDRGPSPGLRVSDERKTDMLTFLGYRNRGVVYAL